LTATQVVDQRPSLPCLRPAMLLRGKFLEMKAKKDLRLVSAHGPSIADKNVTQCECGYDREEDVMVKLLLLVFRGRLSN